MAHNRLFRPFADGQQSILTGAAVELLPPFPFFRRIPILIIDFVGAGVKPGPAGADVNVVGAVVELFFIIIKRRTD